MSLLLGSANPNPDDPPESMEVVREPDLRFDLRGAEKECECGICWAIPTDPVLTNCCGATFCESCVDKVIQESPEGNRSCPKCRKNPVRTSKNRPLLAVLEAAITTCTACGGAVTRAKAQEHFAMHCPAVKVKCTCSARGCTWTGTRAEFQQTHKDDCKFTDAVASAEVRRLLYSRDRGRDAKVQRLKALLEQSAATGSSVDDVGSVLSPLALFGEIRTHELLLLKSEAKELGEVVKDCINRCERSRWIEALKSVPDNVLASWLWTIRGNVEELAPFLAWEVPHVCGIVKALSELPPSVVVDLDSDPEKLHSSALCGFVADFWALRPADERRAGNKYDIPPFPITLPTLGNDSGFNLAQIKLLQAPGTQHSSMTRLARFRTTTQKRGHQLQEEKANSGGKNSRKMQRQFGVNGSHGRELWERETDPRHGRCHADRVIEDIVWQLEGADEVSGDKSFRRWVLQADGLETAAKRKRRFEAVKKALMPVLTAYVFETAARRAFAKNADDFFRISSEPRWSPGANLTSRLESAGRHALGLVKHSKQLSDFKLITGSTVDGSTSSASGGSDSEKLLDGRMSNNLNIRVSQATLEGDEASLYYRPTDYEPHVRRSGMTICAEALTEITATDDLDKEEPGNADEAGAASSSSSNKRAPGFNTVQQVNRMAGRKRQCR